MVNFLYLYSKLLKKMRGPSIINSDLGFDSKIESGSSFTSSTLGRHSYLGYDCKFTNVSVGAFCSIADGVVAGGASHPVDFVSTSPVFLSHKDSVKSKFSDFEYNPKIQTTIGNDVWIGDGALIKSGVNIGDGCVVGMGSVVTKDVPPYAIIAGNPAKLIRYRFTQQIIEDLLKIRWWNFNRDELKFYAKFFDNPEKFIEQFFGIKS